MNIETESAILRNAASIRAIAVGNILTVLAQVVLCIFLFQTFASIWTALSGEPVEPPRVAFMSSYSEPAKNGYWTFLYCAIFSGAIFSFLFPLFAGASIGHFLIGLRYVCENGQKIGLKNIALKYLSGIIFFLIITMPGPIIGFTFGHGSEFISLTALMAGILAVIYLTTSKGRCGRSWSFRFSGLIPVRNERKEILLCELEKANHN